MTGDDPGSASWRQIKGDHYKVIYPDGTDSIARRYLYLFEKTHETNRAELHVDIPYMPIIIHPYEVRSNGATVWVPRRLEIYSTPMYDPLFPCNWETMLALHEGRHVGQMTHYTKGVFKALSYLVGEQSAAPGMALFSDSYMMEGDAVLHETNFTSSGRGRSAWFLRHYRTSFISGEYNSFTKWRLGAYDKYYPNIYTFGYLFASHLRDETGNVHVNGDLFETESRLWWKTFWNYVESHKAVSGLAPRTLWSEAVSGQADRWIADDAMRAPFSPRKDLVSKRGRMFTRYTEIFRQDSSSLIMTKSGLGDSRQLVKVDASGNQKRLRYISSETSNLKYDGRNSIYFAEIVPDPRWTLRSFSILRKYDIPSGRITDITKRSRYFNPALSDEDGYLLAVEYMVEGGSRLVKVNCEDGTAEKVADAPDGGQLVEVAVSDGKIYATAIIEDGIGIYEMKEDGWRTIVDPQPSNINYLNSDGKKGLSFNSDLDGVDNVYFLDPSTGNLDRVTSSRFGTSSPSVDTATNTLFYSDYDLNGFAPVSVSLDSVVKVRKSFANPYKYTLADELAEQSRQAAKKMSAEEDSILYKSVYGKESSRFSKMANLFHIHSWAPLYVNIDRVMEMSFENINRTVAPGVMMMSQNLLGTAVTTAGYSYHNGFHAGHLNFNYSGLYPVFELAVDFNDRQHTVTNLDAVDNIIRYRGSNIDSPSLEIAAKVYLPLDFSRSGWSVGIIPQIQYNFNNDKVIYTGDMTRYHSLGCSFRYYRMKDYPTSCVYPRWGYGVNLGMRSVSSPLAHSDRLYYFNLYGYLPGFTSTQGLRLSCSRQWQKSLFNYGSIGNMVSMPRGYEERVLTDYSLLSADYVIPIYAVSGAEFLIGYLKRMRVIPFVDAAIDRSLLLEEGILKDREKAEKMLSYGFDWMIDGNLFNMSMNLSVGFRYARTLDGSNYMGVLFSTDL
ncbi:MAG: hypothetical protein KBT00_06905 [Bacteroidales bacterium]|nr:hypothetical protein [Candidatus Cacconaster merdequi]